MSRLLGMRSFARTLSASCLSAVLVALALSTGCVRTGARPLTHAETFDVSELYRSVVLVRSGVGGASGVLVEPDLVLTADHVVHGAHIERQARWVEVFAPVSTPDGIVPEATPVRGFVVSRDPAADLALLRLERPLDGTTPLEMSPDDPRVGEEVACVGHGRGHLLWSTRRGYVEAFGSEAIRTLRDRACVHGRAAACQVSRARSTEMASEVLETSCRVSGGDSGGPLVDARGRLVGVASYTEYAADGYDVAYFVHPRALRRMLAERPREPLPDVPEPPAPPARGVGLDLDQDGVWESLAENTGDPYLRRTWMDLDASSSLAHDERGDVRAGSLAAFDPELVLIEGDDHGTHLFVDANEDDELDTLVFLDRRTFAARGVFRRHGDRWVRDQPHEARWSAALDETLVGPASRERWRRWLEQGGERPWEGPRPSSLSRGQLEDLDRDGRVDSLVTVDRDLRYDVLWEVTAVDVDQAWPARERVDERLRAPRSGIDFVIFASPGNFFRAWYDRDGDGTFETVLDASADGTVTRAELRREGAIELQDELVGTLVGRPDFVRTERDRARALLEEIVGPHRIHHDAGVDLRLLRDDDQLYFDGSDLPTGVFRGESLFGTVYAFDLEGDAVTEPQPDLVDDAEAWVFVGGSVTRVVVDLDRDGRPELSNQRLVSYSGQPRCWSTTRVGERYERRESSCDGLFDLSPLRASRLRAPLQAKLHALGTLLGEEQP